MKTPPENVCAIWGTPAEIARSSPFNYQYDSPRAGGTYIIDLLAWHRLPRELPLVRSRLTTWLVNQRRAGEEWPQITADVIEEAASARPLRVSERFDRFFMFLNSIRHRPGAGIGYRNDSDPILARLAAWTESESIDELHSLLNLMRSARWLEGGIANLIALTPLGFERMEVVEQEPTVSNQAFVAMWFGADMAEPYRQGFAPGIRDAGFNPLRIDQKEHSNKIDDEIVMEIRRSRFVVADFSCPLIQTREGKIVSSARGGVYYEAGFAQGLGKPLIWTVRADCIDYVHFDTRQFAHILWDDPVDLRASLRARIGAVIGQGAFKIV